MNKLLLVAFFGINLVTGTKAIAQDNYSTEDLIAIIHISTDSLQANVSNKAFYYNLRGSAYLLLNEFDKALNDLNTYLELGEPDPEAYQKIGDIQFEKGMFESAIEFYNKAININPDPKYFILRGVANEKLSKFDEAINDYTKGTESDEYKIMAFSNRAILHVELERYHEAINDFDILIKLDPENSDYYYDRALYKMKLNNYGEAINGLNIALKINEEINSYLLRAHLHALIGEFNTAYQDLEKASNLDSANSYLYYYSGLVYNLDNKKELACKEFKKAIALGLTIEDELIEKCY